MLLLLLIGSMTGVNADCHACISGTCHSRNILIEKNYPSKEMAIDRTDNILYYGNTALYLNELNVSKTWLKQKKGRTSGLVVDQKTQDVYTSQYGAVYRYKYKQKYTLEKFTLGSHIANELCYDDTLYLITPAGRLVYLNKTTGAVHENHLQDYEITDMVKVNATTFFVANNNVYKYNWDDETTQLICKNKQILSADKYGDVYFVDNYQKIIYKRYNTTGNLEVYASFKSGAIKDFVLDKYNKIIFKDMNNVVSQWVPETTKCVNLLPQDKRTNS